MVRVESMRIDSLYVQVRSAWVFCATSPAGYVYGWSQEMTVQMPVPRFESG